MLQLEMERLSLKKAAEGVDRGAKARLSALEEQLEGERCLHFNAGRGHAFELFCRMGLGVWK